jgi:hypothetical protein
VLCPPIVRVLSAYFAMHPGGAGQVRRRSGTTVGGAGVSAAR